MAHAFVTVVVPFDDLKAGDVRAHLRALGNPARAPIADPLNRGMFVHFMSLTVVPGSPAGPAHLVLEVSADGHPRSAIGRLVGAIGPRLRELLGVAGVVLSDSQVGAFLGQHERQVGSGWFAVPGVVFAGTPGMTVERILREQELATDIQARLDAPHPQNSALETLQWLRAQLFDAGDYKWAFVAEQVPLLAEAAKAWWRVYPPILWSGMRTFLWPLALLIALAFVWKGILGALVTLGAEVVAGALAARLAYRALRRKEKGDAPDGPGEPAADAMQAIMEHENRCMQNHLAAVSTLKPGRLRRLTLRLALWAVGAFSRHHSRPGYLGDIGTIHFARWILLPGTDKLLFFSNYTGSWESYLEDFIAKLHEGLSAIWSNTRGFPRTNNLIQDGATAADLFKGWARRQQNPTLCWYTAYPDLTTHRIRTNAAIRHGLATATTEAEAARWLVHFRFPSPVPPERALASDDIPTLVFGGLSRLPHAQALIVRLPAVVDGARRWLATIEPHIAFGEHRRPEGWVLALGLSESGLRKLGLGDETRSTFPTAFQQGMDMPWRSQVLGDRGDNAPSTWWWGTGPNKADAILNVYAMSDVLLQYAVGALEALLDELGGAVIHRILLATVPEKAPTQEPFGFIDGISQPIVRGASRSVVARNQIHVVEPGEMILGYPDNSGQRPSSPRIGEQDLGRNGTYLVVRQLEQDAEAFNRYLDAEADRLLDDPRVPVFTWTQRRKWIAAKIVGRWQDGTSLVRHPGAPGSASRPDTPPDNDFMFGTEDPDGLRCPFGAHIRRVNPRDSFDAGSKVQLDISNRHRILRVGRRYLAQNGSEKPGLLFMCLNANIERQFEFMQQTYMLGASFHGLENEVDSFARRDGLSGVLTIPTEHGPLRLQGMGGCVRVRGGGYFFMPGQATVRLLAAAH